MLSCRTMADYNYLRIDSNLQKGKYDEVLAELESNAAQIYGIHDDLLAELDRGIILHFNKNPLDSNKSLGAAEKLALKYEAKSVTQSIASSVTNDTVKDYAGEDFENIYTNIFMALNYIQLNEFDEAMVEVRRFDNKIKQLRAKYEEEVRNQDGASKDVKVEKHYSRFTDSALGRYLSMLMYRTDGDMDNAGVDLRYLKDAYSKQPALYDFACPSSVDQELTYRPSKNAATARLNVLAFSGMAPVKKEEVIRAYYGPSVWYKLALPVMKKNESKINRIQVVAKNDKTGQTYQGDLQKIESLENISIDTFGQAYSILYTKALIRSIARAVTNSTLSTLSNEASRQDNAGAALILMTFDIAHKMATELVERADVRSCRYFPATASVTGLSVEPGTYTVTVNYYNGRHLLFSESRSQKVSSDTLNLVESSCLR